MAGLDASLVVVVGYTLGRPNFGAASRLQADEAVHYAQRRKRLTTRHHSRMLGFRPACVRSCVAASVAACVRECVCAGPIKVVKTCDEFSEMGPFNY